MALVDSLLAAIVRADGDALVMHVGERPYVVVGTNTINISTHGLNLESMTGMLAQLLSAEALLSLEEFGAVEHRLPQDGDDRFSVVAARGGDDIWIEIRRRRGRGAAQEPAPRPVTVAPIPPPEPVPAAAIEVAAETPPVVVEPPAPIAEPEPEPVTIQAEVAPEPIPEPVIWEPEPVMPEPALIIPESEPVMAKPELIIPEPEPVMAEPALIIPEPEPVIAAQIEFVKPDEPAERVEPAATAVVVPLTRTVRIEVPPRQVAAPRISNVERLLRLAVARGASSLFLASDSPPYMRVERDMRQIDSEPVMSRAELEGAILEIAPDGQESASKSPATEWITEFADLGRVRCTTFTDHRGRGLHLSLIATRAATAEQLGLAPEVQALATEPQGLVLVAGPRGSGKSTLISALVDLVNRQRAEYVITLERQIRLVHDNRVAVVSQREIRGAADDAVAAARAALRENPGVLVVDDLVSAHMVPLLLTAASEGLLVFVSMAAASTTDAVQRFVEMAAPEMRPAVQNAMAESFRGAVAQVLLKKSGGGQVPAREVLLATAAVTRLIGEGQLGQLPVALENGRRHGMLSFTDALVAFVRSNAVDVREAFRKAPDRQRLLDALKREGIDTAAVERLA